MDAQITQDPCSNPEGTGMLIQTHTCSKLRVDALTIVMPRQNQGGAKGTKANRRAISAVVLPILQMQSHNSTSSHARVGSLDDPRKRPAALPGQQHRGMLTLSRRGTCRLHLWQDVANRTRFTAAGPHCHPCSSFHGPAALPVGRLLRGLSRPRMVRRSEGPHHRGTRRPLRSRHG